MNEELICCHDDSQGYRCEYDGAYGCRHPYANGPVLTSTLNGAHPANCPKLPGMAISPEEKYRRESEKLKRGKSFRFGGTMHDYDATAKDFAQTHCYHCKKEFTDDEKPYCRTFKVGEGGLKFGIICRECAYSFGDGVIERNGKTYYKPEEYKGEI